MVTLNWMTASDVDNAIPEHWDTKVRHDAALQAFWDPFLGKEGSSMPGIIKNDFTKGPKDVVHIQVLSEIGGDGVEDENTLEGSEDKYTIGQFDVTVTWIRNAVAWSKKANKEAIFDAIVMANLKLSKWLARHKDRKTFESMLTASGVTTLYPNDETADTGLDSNDTLGATEIDRLRLALIRQGAIPIQTIHDGKQSRPVYGCVISDIDEWNLGADPNWVEAVELARKRDPNNPIFTMAWGMYKGMLIYTHYGLKKIGTPLRPEAGVYGAHTNIITTLTVGSNVRYNYTKHFPTTGTLCIIDTDDSKEFCTYTGKTNTTFTGLTRGVSYGDEGAAGGAESYEGDELVTLYNSRSQVIGFGGESFARAWGQHPQPIQQEHDYGFERGVGVEALYGHKAIEDSAGDFPNFVLMNCYSQNPGNVG